MARFDTYILQPFIERQRAQVKEQKLGNYAQVYVSADGERNQTEFRVQQAQNGITQKRFQVDVKSGRNLSAHASYNDKGWIHKDLHKTTDTLSDVFQSQAIVNEKSLKYWNDQLQPFYTGKKLALAACGVATIVERFQECMTPSKVKKSADATGVHAPNLFFGTCSLHYMYLHVHLTRKRRKH